jgi:hypothetical protein
MKKMLLAMGVLLTLSALTARHMAAPGEHCVRFVVYQRRPWRFEPPRGCIKSEAFAPKDSR